jgi:hypothetical protein
MRRDERASLIFFDADFADFADLTQLNADSLIKPAAPKKSAAICGNLR